ncbi:MAG: hypothetical protein MRK01_16000 [Candidatus Scalindua sp.]|nr:hypothetical protein [Candidatus Scalindua sp.]
MIRHYHVKVFKSIFLIVCFFVMFSVVVTLEALAAEYYIDPVNGKDSDTGLSQTLAWATFSYAMEQLTAGDTLYLMDGTFTESLKVTISGIPGNPITFKALNDGQATVDGRNSRIPFSMRGASTSNHLKYVDVEGIVFRNSSNNVIDTKYIDHVTFRRVSGYDADANLNVVVFSFWASDNILVEDCAAGGTGRKMFSFFNCTFVTSRRCFGLWKSTNLTETEGINPYGASDCLQENCIHMDDPAGDKNVKNGILIVDNGGVGGSRNRVYGCISRDANANYMISSQKSILMTGNEFKNNVSLNADNFGIQQRAGNNCKMMNFTIVNAAKNAVKVNAQLFGDSGILYGDMRNSSLISSGGTGINVVNSIEVKGFVHSYNNLYGMTNNYSGTSAGTGEISVNPNYDTETYGDGAYLMVPIPLKGRGENGADIGAEVLYQYIDGTLYRDDQHRLWPWPMEDRIFAETGISVTWKAKGGLWKTLTGVYGNPTHIAAPKGFKMLNTNS